MREDINDLKKFELVYPARDLLNVMISSARALTQMPIDEERAKSLRLVLGFLNAYIKAYNTKIGYFKLTMIPEKLKSSMKKKFKKFK